MIYERCIVLFNNAHYAISGIDADTENYGVRPSYNTSYDDGAYQSAGHSFGEWAGDHTAVTDWYEYPRTSLVYRAG